jgi:putative hydrolase of the HAD superfamily
MIKAVCLDFGETLAYVNGVSLSWKDHYSNALNQAFSICKYAVSEKQILLMIEILENYNTRIHPRDIEYSDIEIFSKSIEYAQIKSKNLDFLITEFFNYFRVKYNYYEDVVPFLENIKDRNIPIGILTDVPYGMRKQFVIDDIDQISKYIDCVFTSVEIGYRKPNISGYLKLVNELGFSSDSALYIGNEEKDIVGANKAGMISVLIDRNNDLPPYEERYRIGTLSEIIHIL